MLEYVLLGMLMEGQMSGYDLKKTIDSTIGHFYAASFGSLYPALKRLQVLSGQSAFQTVLQIIYALLIGGALALLALYCVWLALSLKKPSVPRTAEQSFN